MAIQKGKGKGKGKSSHSKPLDKKKATSSERKAKAAAAANKPAADARPSKPQRYQKQYSRPDEYAYDIGASKSVKIGKNRSLRDVVNEKGRTKAHADRLEGVTPQPRPARTKKQKKDTEAPKTETIMPTFKVIAGSYEKLLYGLEVSFNPSDASSSPSAPNVHTRPTPTFKPIFIFPAHIGCVRTVASSGGSEVSSGKWLATGSTADEIIKIWDLRKRKEVGGLLQHQGSITYLTFPSPSHLLTCSEDGTICLFRSRDWVLLRSFKGHKGRVNAVAVHPSGKLALSVGKDRTIRMWDFMRGKAAGSTKIYKEAECVKWAPSGTKFAIQVLNSIEVFSTSMIMLQQITHTARIQDIQFVLAEGKLGGEVLLVAGEDKRVAVYEEIETGDASTEQPEGESQSSSEYKITAEFVGHESRVKAIATLPVTFSDRSKTIYLSTIGSDGKILLYDVASALSTTIADSPKSVSPIASYDTKGSRLTSLTMALGDSPLNGANDEDERDEDSEDSEADGDQYDEVGEGDEGDDLDEEMDEREDEPTNGAWGGLDGDESN